MKKISLLMVLCCTMIVVANTSYEPQAFDTIVVGQDTLLAPRHPEPVHLDLRPVRKAAAACPLDSVVGLDANQNYASKIEYEYDEAGHTIIETRYQWVNGVKTGVSKYWKKYTGNTATTTVNYKWDATINNWVNNDSTQYLYYDNGKMKSNATYVWTDNVWRDNTIIEYVYNTNNNLLLSTNKSWNTNKQALDYISKHEYAYDSYNNKILDATWTYSNETWIGNTKDEWKYDSNRNKLSEESYYGWENNNWKGRSNGKNIYEYDAAKNITKRIMYTWSSGTWVESTKTETAYDGSNKADEAVYSWKNGAWAGTSRTSKTWESGKTTEEIIWKWNNDAWEWNTKTQYIYSGSNICEQTPLKWDGTQWIGNGTKWKKTFVFTNKIETQINYSWNTDKWVESTKDSTKWISSSLSESISSYKWNDGNWIGTKKVRNTYNSANKLISNETLAWGGDETNWRDSLHTLYEYNENNIEILKVNAKKVGDDWVAVDSTKHEIEYITIAGKKLTKSDFSAKWTATSGTWTGTGTKILNEYDSNGNKILINTYTIKNGIWVNKDSTRYEYKDGNASLKILEVKMTWNTDRWTGNYKNEYTYGDTITNTRYTWNKTINDWIGGDKSSIIYQKDGKTVLATILYSWNDGKKDWVSSIKHEYEYDLHGNQIKDITYIFDVKLGLWQGQQMLIKEYDNKHSEAVRSDVYVWNADDEDWCFQSKNEISYDDDADGKLRYQLDAAYTNCVLSTYDLKRYYYRCDPKQFTIIFNNWDGSQLTTFKAEEGITPAYPDNLDTPTKDGDTQYSYTFKGWDKDLVPVTGDATYTAVFEQSVNSYTITFVNEDNSPLQTTNVAYGTTPEYTGTTPAKGGDAQYSYTFKGWDNDLVPVTGDATYTAVFEQNVNSYTITFVNEDNSPLQSTEVAYGTTPEYTGTTPAKGGDAQYSYTFKGWDNDLVPVTGDATYTAVFEQSVNTYDVTFEVKGDASKSYTIEDVPYGTLVNELAEQVKTLFGTTFEDDTYIYTFTGLENVTETDIVTENATFYVLYSAEPKKPTDIDHIEQSAGATKVMENGVLYIIRDGKRYHTTGTLAD